MKLLTKKKQNELMHDLLTLYTLGSDGLKAVGTKQEDKMTPIQALRRQQKMTAAAMNAAHILRGMYGMQLMMAVEKRKQEEEEKHGFPLQLLEQNKED